MDFIAPSSGPPAEEQAYAGDIHYLTSNHCLAQECLYACH